MKSICFDVFISTVSEANSSEGWRKKNNRHKNQQWFVRMAFEQHVKAIYLPCVVTMTRLSTRLLDDDNLVCSFKWIRDEISECIFPEKRGFYVTKKGNMKKIKGRADSDPRIKWRYAQQKHPIQGIRIQIDF